MGACCDIGIALLALVLGGCSALTDFGAYTFADSDVLDASPREAGHADGRVPDARADRDVAGDAGVESTDTGAEPNDAGAEPGIDASTADAGAPDSGVECAADIQCQFDTDGNQCTLPTCGTGGQCVESAERAMGRACDDGRSCTTADTCDGSGFCIGDPMGTNGTFCTESSVTGVCCDGTCGAWDGGV